MDWWVLPLLAICSLVFAVSAERILRARADDRLRLYEHEQKQRAADLKLRADAFNQLAHITMTQFGAFVAWLDDDDHIAGKWYIPSTEAAMRATQQAIAPAAPGNGQTRDLELRRNALRLLEASDQLHPDDTTRLASQDDMQARGMSPVTHSETVNWLATLYGVLPTKKGTFCGHPFVDRATLWNGVITLTGERPIPPPRAGMNP